MLTKMLTSFLFLKCGGIHLPISLGQSQLHTFSVYLNFSNEQIKCYLEKKIQLCTLKQEPGAWIDVVV